LESALPSLGEDVTAQPIAPLTSVEESPATHQ